ncbi:MAG: aspartate-semialdehyde dehydrogenase [Bacteroidetes bacterium]|nr:aspartate-semialdehyde dehydrogenase [Bacteroidota bacterium]
MKLALVGVTGLVGGVMSKVLEERNFHVNDFIPVASEKSVGREVKFKGRGYRIVSLKEAVAQKPKIAIFSAGSAVALEWAPKFAEAGTTVIDNSSAWRMSKEHRLIVPEINAAVLKKTDKIISNPNCSTIQMVMVLAPLHKKYKVKRVVVSTYQSVTGTGIKAVEQMMNERKSIQGEMVYPYPIDLNVIPHIDAFLENGYTKEEMKMVEETKKIMGDDKIKVTATAVRIPVVGGHSESVNVEFESEFDLDEVRKILAGIKGIKVVDDVKNLKYPMPIDAKGLDDVLVGRIRRDETQKKTLNLWIVADNLRKGAATNAVQIAEFLVQKKLV